MGVLSDIWDGVRTTLSGLKVTIPYIWRKPVTTMYPHERLELPERTRNRLYVNMDDCIGCDQCARACPVNCISIETVKAVEGDSPGVTSNGKKKALWVTRFDIDIAKCCYCGLCVYPCPTECIKMTDVFEFAEQERNNLIYNYITLTPDEAREKIARAEEAEAALAARKAAAKAAAQSAPATSVPPPAPGSAVPPASVAPGMDDPEKAAKLAELQAKMAAAKAKREADAAASAAPSTAPPPAGPASPVAPLDDPEKAAKIAELQAKMAAAKAKREADAGAATPSAPSASAEGELPVPPGTDPEKAAKIAELQAKMAAAKAKREADAAASASPAPAAPAPSAPSASAEGGLPVPPGTDPEKAAKIAELQAKMAAAKAKREADAAAAHPASAPVPADVPVSDPAPEVVPASKVDEGSDPGISAPADEDAEKAARVAALKEKIAALKRARGEE